METSKLGFQDNFLIAPLYNFDNALSKHKGHPGLSNAHHSLLARIFEVVGTALTYLALGTLALVGYVFNTPILYITARLRENALETSVDHFALNTIFQLRKHQYNGDTKSIVSIEYGPKKFYASMTFKQNEDLSFKMHHLTRSIYETLRDLPLYKGGEIKWRNFHKINDHELTISHGWKKIDATVQKSGVGYIHNFDMKHINNESHLNRWANTKVFPELIMNDSGRFTPGMPFHELVAPAI